MSERTMELQGFMKSLPKIGGLTGTYVLCMDADGTLKKSDATVMEFRMRITDIDDIDAPGFYQPTASALNTPSPANSSDQIIYLGSPVYAVMIYIPVNGQRIFKRAKHAGVWKPWGYLDFTPVPQT